MTLDMPKWLRMLLVPDPSRLFRVEWKGRVIEHLGIETFGRESTDHPWTIKTINVAVRTPVTPTKESGCSVITCDVKYWRSYWKQFVEDIDGDVKGMQAMGSAKK